MLVGMNLEHKVAVVGFVMLLPISAGAQPVDQGSRSRPNILFCIADDASQPHFGAYGCTWTHTPAFDRVAREGLLFTNAWTPNAKCAPSRACILTGRNTWQLEEACNHMPFFPSKFVTYVETLQQHGYFCGKTAKGWSPGVANDEQGHPRELTGKPFDKRRLNPPAQGITNTDYAGNFEEFLDAKPADEPFCFWYGCREPHRRYQYGVGVSQGGKSLTDIGQVPQFWPDNETIRNDLLDYGYEIEYFDQHLGRMLGELERRDQLDNTLVVVTSDNGMPFPRIKGQEYKLSNNMPLAVMWPTGIQHPGRVVEDFVSFIDLAPTFLELARLDPAHVNMQPITGKSLTPILSGTISEPHRDHVLIGKERHDVGRPNDWGYPMRGIAKGEFLYLRNFEPTRWPAGDPMTGYLNCDGSPTKTAILALNRLGTQQHFWQSAFGKRPGEELYNLMDDPECMNNLADDAAHRDIKASLQKKMENELLAEFDPRALGFGEVFENYPVALPIARFYERFQAGEKLNAGWVNETDFEEIDFEE